MFIVTFILYLCRWFVKSHLSILHNHASRRCLQSNRVWSHENPIRFLGWKSGFHCSTAANWHHEWGRVFLNEGCETLLLKYARLSVRAHCLLRRRHSAAAARRGSYARPPPVARRRPRAPWALLSRNSYITLKFPSTITRAPLSTSCDLCTLWSSFVFESLLNISYLGRYDRMFAAYSSTSAYLPAWSFYLITI